MHLFQGLIPPANVEALIQLISTQRVSIGGVEYGMKRIMYHELLFKCGFYLVGKAVLIFG